FGVAVESETADGHVVAAGGVVNERKSPVGCVVAACCVAEKRSIAIGRIAVTFGVVKEGESSVGSVLLADGVGQKRARAGGGVFDPLKGAGVSEVEEGGGSADGVLEAAVGIAPKRKKTNCCVNPAGSEAKQGALPLRRVATGIAAVRRRDNCFCQRHGEAKREGNEK